MFDRKAHIEAMKLAMPEWSIEKIEQDADAEEKRNSKVKVGDNVVHINYCGPILADADLQEIDNALKSINYELSTYDTGGRVMASSLYDSIIDVFLYLNQPIVREVILLGLGTNAAWDAIKTVIALTYKKVRGKTVHTMTSSSVTERKVSFNLIVKIEQDKTLKFLIEDIEDHQIENALDQIRGSISAPEKTKSDAPQVAIYNPEENSWKFVDFNSSMLKARQKIVRSLSMDDYIKEVDARENQKQ